MYVAGELMTQSHVSCRDDYECSAPDLDELVDLCMANGAFGARCVVCSARVFVCACMTCCVVCVCVCVIG